MLFAKLINVIKKSKLNINMNYLFLLDLYLTCYSKYVPWLIQTECTKAVLLKTIIQIRSMGSWELYYLNFVTCNNAHC